MIWAAGRRAAAAMLLAAITWGGAQAATTVSHQTIWVPDYYGGKISRTAFDYTTNPVGFTQKTSSVAAHRCNPNSVVVIDTALYVICNSDFGGKDQILVLNADTLIYQKTIVGHGSDGYDYFTGSSLIGSVVDRHGNLWVSGYNSNTLLRIPASQLAKSIPHIDREVIDSPDQPAGLAVDVHGSFWIVGQFDGGIVLNFDDAVLNQAGTFNHNNPLNPTPVGCVANTADGCTLVPGLFNNPEGVAIFNGTVWVSNNGGNAPGKSLVNIVPKAGPNYTTTTYGGTFRKPFSCPGGLFAPVINLTRTPFLWVNDEGYGMAATDCGASQSSRGSQVGRVLEFTATDLSLHKTAPTPEQFTGWNRMKTGSPGFGGIFARID